MVFSRTVTDYWLTREAGAGFWVPGTHHIVVDDSLPENRSLTLFEPVDGESVLTLTPALADRLGLVGQRTVGTESLARALDAAGVRLNGADHLFYLPMEEQASVSSEPIPQRTRQLTDRDAHAFEDFVAQAPADDLDEAFVELHHWLVFGTFAEDQLVSAASMYPWQDTRMADLGVITLPGLRGQGHARATVRAISARALERGFEPQYRCQLDNHPSIALARATGFSRFGTWDAIDIADD